MSESLDISLEEKLNLLADTKLRYKEAENKFRNDTAELREILCSLEEEIKSEVIKIGATVKTDSISAVYKKGRQSWNTKLLDGYSIAHPEILKLKTIGEPTISFVLKR